MNTHLPAIHIETAITIGIFVLCFAVYHRDLLAGLFLRPFMGRMSPGRQQAYTLFLRRFSGVILFGIIPLTSLFLIYGRSAAEYGLKLPDQPIWYLAGIGLCVLFFPVLAITIRKSTLRESVPYARLTEWRRSDRFWNLISWMFYLIAYEAGLRGYLLFSLERSVGEWPAILLMTAIYTIIHINKRWEEAALSVVGGPVLGYLALNSGSIIIPWMIHVFVANVSDALVLRLESRRSLQS